MKLTTAIVLLSTLNAASAFTGISSFKGRRQDFVANANQAATGYRDSYLFYEREGGNSRGDSNVWSVLANTEKWISETLAASETSNGNPYSRKEVNYVCETNEESAMIAANLFKRLREARELGQQHGESEEDHKADQGPSYRPHTLRQTQVMVIPGNKILSENFKVFDDFINAVNAARRNARDYVTDSSLEKLEDSMAGEENRDWSVSVNCAHLHPDFGKKTAEETLQQMKEEEEQGEVDLHAQEYAEKRLQARRSPYPCVVVECKSSPPPDFGNHAIPQPPPAAVSEEDDDDDNHEVDYNYNRKELLRKEVTSADIQALEAMFGLAAATDHPVHGGGSKGEDSGFYDSIGKSIEEVSPLSHMQMGQDWINDNDEKFSPVTSAFTESDTPEVDHAYEFVFTNIAMLEGQTKQDKTNGSHRQYLLMPHFLSSSATSLEKFTKEVMNIVKTLPDLSEKVKVSTFHPEHVQQPRRSPFPIICLQWTEAGEP